MDVGFFGFDGIARIGTDEGLDSGQVANTFVAPLIKHCKLATFSSHYQLSVRPRTDNHIVGQHSSYEDTCDVHGVPRGRAGNRLV